MINTMDMLTDEGVTAQELGMAIRVLNDRVAPTFRVPL